MHSPFPSRAGGARGGAFPRRGFPARLLWAALGAALAALRVTGQEPVAEAPARQLVIDPAPIVEAPLTGLDREAWAFQPVRRPPLPAVRTASWPVSPVDVFILARLEAEGLAPAPQAPRPTLLRRLTFDLIGLPPTPEELAAFETLPAPDVYERQVDRLLAHPAHGERYAQHWLDLARFAETDGYEHDKVRPEAWRYRDWIIAALAADMPYDEFIRLQLAADLLADGRASTSAPAAGVAPTARSSPARAIAAANPKAKSKAPKVEIAPRQVPTMFCLAGPDMPDVNDQDERRHNLLNELTATVGSVFLGLQFGCAQCHDHKYDPLSQGDFYRLRAFFEPAVAVLQRDVPYSALAMQPAAPAARYWVRGDHRRPGPEVRPAFPRIADAGAPQASAAATPADSAAASVPGAAPQSAPVLSRVDLAAWLVSAENPLTSRVMANRIWQWHFGRGLCQTPSDFGAMGGPVTHPELLDWLAAELREAGWSLRRLHRQIVSSATYRQGSLLAASDATHAAPGRAADSDHALYAHFPRRRLEGEALRDAMLAVAGLLSTERGGPGVMPPLPEELVGTLLKGQWTASPREADHYRRSVYVFARRNLRYPIFQAFDRPDANASCPLRGRSTTAPQSLLLFNSEFSLLAARHLAGRVLASGRDESEQITALYRLALAREPTADEAALVREFLAQQRSRLAAEGRTAVDLALAVPQPAGGDALAAAALVDACLALLNANEFLYLD